MQTKKLALLSTMLVAISGAALADVTAGSPKDLIEPAVEQAEAVQDTASNAVEGADALAQGSTPSIGTSDQAFEGEVLAGMTADEVLGMAVVDVNGETVGEVSDLLIATDGTVDRAIVDVGGFLGLGTKAVALDVTSLTVAEGDGELVSDVNAEALEAMPEWQQDDSGWFSF